MATDLKPTDGSTPEYLAQLLKDQKQIEAFPNVFLHCQKLLADGEWFVYSYVSLLYLSEHMFVNYQIQPTQKFFNVNACIHLKVSIVNKTLT